MVGTDSNAVKALSSFDLQTGCLFDASDDDLPTALYAWAHGDTLHLPNLAGDALFGFIHEGPAAIEAEHNHYQLVTGQYFCFSENVTASGGAGIVIKRIGFSAQNLLGGPIEPVGRLRYIDGCTDSLLVPPVTLGGPCLNALYFPPGIHQTPHTHPSIRVGLTARGTGKCFSPEGFEALVPGRAFVIHANGVHSFRTDREPLVVIAYHPDSDFGPRDEDHPMINRTIVDGVSASRLSHLRTR
jgi:hypothetical protein